MAFEKPQLELFYKSRLARLKKLIDLNAPAIIISRECLLVAGAAFDVTQLISRVETLTKSEENRHRVEDLNTTGFLLEEHDI